MHVPVYSSHDLVPHMYITLLTVHRKVSQAPTVAGIPYSYPTAASFLPVDQSGLRSAAGYPFMIPGQYAVAAPYQQVNSKYGPFEHLLVLFNFLEQVLLSSFINLAHRSH